MVSDRLKYTMSIREATLDDQDCVLQMFNDMSLELDANYPENNTPHSKGAMDGYRTIFRSYVTGTLDGVCVVWTPKGYTTPQAVSMAGSSPGNSLMPVRWEKAAWVWGVYVTPECRLKPSWHKIYKFGRKRLRELGFSHITGHVFSGNKAAYRLDVLYGGTPYAILLEKDLRTGSTV